jgi:hypothetical protein
MKQEFINDVHNYIDLDTTDEETKEKMLSQSQIPRFFKLMKILLQQLIDMMTKILLLSLALIPSLFNTIKLLQFQSLLTMVSISKNVRTPKLKKIDRIWKNKRRQWLIETGIILK